MELLEVRAAVTTGAEARPREHVGDVLGRTVASRRAGASPLHLGRGQGGHVRQEVRRAAPRRRRRRGGRQQKRQRRAVERGEAAARHSYYSMGKVRRYAPAIWRTDARAGRRPRLQAAGPGRLRPCGASAGWTVEPAAGGRAVGYL
jgi:hypothetical protein